VGLSVPQQGVFSRPSALRRPRWRWRGWLRGALLAAIVLPSAATLAPSPSGRGQAHSGSSAEPQITVFALRAEPDSQAVDPRLSHVIDPLRKVLPNHGFRLLAVSNQRLRTGEALTCEWQEDRKLTVRLLDAADADGKLHLDVRFFGSEASRPTFITSVRTPPSQPVFLDKALDGTDDRLLIGLGGR